MLLQERNVKFAESGPWEQHTPPSSPGTMDGTCLPYFQSIFCGGHVCFPLLFLRKLVIRVSNQGCSQAVMTHKTGNVYSLALSGKNVTFP